MGDLLLADFKAKSRTYTRCEAGKEPVFEITAKEVDALATVALINDRILERVRGVPANPGPETDFTGCPMSDLTQLVPDIPPDYDPRRGA